MGDAGGFGWGAVFVVAAAIVGCDDAPSAGCVVGRVRECACQAGARGAQTCGADRRYGDCACVSSIDADTAADAADVPVDVGAPPPRLEGCSQGTACDVDGDQEPGPQCGGTDCDDRDCLRYHQNVERCDDVDQDCDPCTVAGARDGDGDGDTYTSSACVNPFVGEAPTCPPGRVTVDAAARRVTGRDCDDANGNQRPDQPEVCNGRDDNCNGDVDDGIPGGPCGTGLPGVCNAGETACREGQRVCAALVTPSERAEVCNAIDDDCDGSVDEELTDVGGDCEVTSGPWAEGEPCRRGALRCVAGVRVCDNAGLRAEACDGVDNDCDGEVDERPEANAVCTAMHASATCVAGRCALPTCQRDLADCNGAISDGCEAELSLDPANCGACGVRCAGRCVGGWCTDGSLAMGAGPAHTCAARGSGVACWGSDDAGEVGDGPGPTTALRPRSVAVGEVAALSLGEVTLAATSSGRVWRWGGGSVVPVDTGVADAVALGVDSVARATGEVLVWRDGELRPTSSLGGVRSLAGAASYALLTDGTVRRRAAGGASTWQSVTLPVRVESLCAGRGFACAAGVDRHLWCWGANDRGQLADGTTVDRDAPAPLAVTGAFTAVSCGEAHACALRADGVVVCWGDNAAGQVGQGFAPTRAEPPTEVSFRDSSVIVSIACGGAHTCARASDGRVYCWGENGRGQLGLGNTLSRASAAFVAGY